MHSAQNNFCLPLDGLLFCRELNLSSASLYAQLVPDGFALYVDAVLSTVVSLNFYGFTGD